MTNDELTPADVIAMPLHAFLARFGFLPTDALDKKWFAATGTRITPFQRAAHAAGVLGEDDLSHVVMDA
jgi:hypothetical protein